MPGPLPTAERAVVLDVLRGVSLLGVLIANTAVFAAPARETALDALGDVHPVDAAAELAVAVLVTGKFYPLFALLFGMGVALQLERAGAARAGTGRVLRRLGVLFAIGVTHAILVWWGDILTVYAVLGTLLVVGFRRRSSRALVRWAVVLLVGPALLAGGAVAGVELARFGLPAFDAEVAVLDADAAAATREEAARLRAVYGDGSYVDTLRDRATAAPIGLAGGAVLGLFSVLPAMLLGMLLVRLGFPARVGARREALGVVRRWGLRLGVPLNVAAVAALYLAGPLTDDGLVAGVLPLVGGLLALGLAAAVALATLDPAWSARLALLAPVGRLALTNYLLGSIVCTSLFSAWGLDLYDRVGVAGQVILAVLLFAGQVALSGWWVRRFRFGPAEWVWRSLTYGRRQPLRVSA